MIEIIYFCRVDEIREQCRLLELTKMLTKYNLRHYNVYESKSAEVCIKTMINSKQLFQLPICLGCLNTVKPFQ